MLVFSTITAILTPIIYMVPFMISWLSHDDERKYVLFKKEIDKKWVLVAKIAIIIILVVAFIFSFPSKVMFYPVKVGIFTGIFLAISVLTGFSILENHLKDDLTMNLSALMVAIFFVTILVNISNIDEKNSRKYLEPKEININYQIKDINSAGTVFYYDENKILQKVSLNDANVLIGPETKDASTITRIETYHPYVDRYDKNPKTINGDLVEEKYELHVNYEMLLK